MQKNGPNKKRKKFHQHTKASFVITKLSQRFLKKILHFIMMQSQFVFWDMYILKNSIDNSAKYIIEEIHKFTQSSPSSFKMLEGIPNF